MPAGKYTAILLPKLRRALRAFLLVGFSGQEERDEADANMDRGRSTRRTPEAPMGGNKRRGSQSGPAEVEKLCISVTVDKSTKTTVDTERTATMWAIGVCEAVACRQSLQSWRSCARRRRPRAAPTGPVRIEGVERR